MGPVRKRPCPHSPEVAPRRKPRPAFEGPATDLDESCAWRKILNQALEAKWPEAARPYVREKGLCLGLVMDKDGKPMVYNGDRISGGLLANINQLIMTELT